MLIYPSNSFFVIPVAHFPWSDKGREAKLERQRTKEMEGRQA